LRRMILNGKEPKPCLGRVFNFKLDSFTAKNSKCVAGKQPVLELTTKTQTNTTDIKM
jgi:hypothetical protein